VGWIVWHAVSGEMRLVFPTEESTGCTHVRYRRPQLDDDEHLVVDLHSHGHLSAFFSTQDDRDDRGEFKIAGVIGNCDRGQCSTAFRLCANGLFLPLAFDETGLNGQAGGNDGYPSSCA
jgi:PRTRC genetic system protein A